MNRLDLDDKFKTFLLNFAKENGLKLNDKNLIDVLKHCTESLSKDYTLDNKYGEHYKNGDKTFDKFSEFHKFIVEQCIDFISKNEDIAKMIENKQKELSDKWIFKQIQPDIRMFFCIDNLDCSIKENKWSSASDSCLSISVGNINVLESV